MLVNSILAGAFCRAGIMVSHGVCGLDVKVEGRRVEVQKRSQSAANWTLKRWEGVLKSKRGAEACRIVLYKILVNKYSACYNMQDVFCIHE